MKIYPAIDIRGGRCVRLKQGDFNKETVYGDDPCKIAAKFCEEGASYIHIVDLDGARKGCGINNEHIKRIIDSTGVKVQTGGGIRDMRAIEEKLAIGVQRVIIGTQAIKNPAFVKEAVSAYGDRIIVGIDAKNGLAAVSGWEEISEVSALKLALSVRELGVKTIIYTDISKDCMMTGPNFAATEELVRQTGMEIIASGGVSSIDDLREISKTGAAGVIIGNALYTGNISLKDAIALNLRSDKYA